MHIQNLTEQQVAPILGLSVKTLQLWRHQRRGPTYLKIGRSVRYSIKDIAEFIEKNRVKFEE